MSAETDLVQQYNTELQETWGDFAKMRSVVEKYVDPDTTLDEAPSLPWGGHWVGVDGFMQVFKIVNEALKNHTDSELRKVTTDTRDVDLAADYFSDGPMVIAQVKRPVQSVEIFEVRNSKIRAVTVYMFDTAAMAAAMTGAP